MPVAAKRRKTGAKGKTVARPEQAPLAAPEAVTPEQHLEAAKGIQKTCMTIEFLPSLAAGLPGARKADKEFIEQVAGLADGESDGYSVSKRLFASNHEAMKKRRACVAELVLWRNLYTVAASANEDGSGTMLKARGKRIIRIEDIDDFEAGWKERAETLKEAHAEVVEAYDDILALDRDRLGSQWQARDYPTQAEVAKLNWVGVPDYKDCTASMKLPPRSQEKMEERLLQQASGHLEVAVEEISNTYTEMFQRRAGSLVRRVRINPVPGHRLAHLDQAIVSEARDSRKDKTVAEGQVKLRLSYKEGEETKYVWETMPLEEFQHDLRPKSTEEAKALHKSTIEQVLHALDAFPKVQEQLGPYGKNMEGAFNSLRGLLAPVTIGTDLLGSLFDTEATDKTVAALHREIKDSPQFRETLSETLNAVGEILEQQATDARACRRSVADRYKGQL